MKRLIVMLAFVAPLIVSTAAGAPPQGEVGITASLASTFSSNGSRTDTLLLWNHNVSNRPIGHAIMGCLRARRIGFRADPLYHCTSTWELPHGKIVATGTVHHFNRFTLVVTGGTRSKRAARDGQPGYPDASGTLFAARPLPGELQVSIRFAP